MSGCKIGKMVEKIQYACRGFIDDDDENDGLENANG
jgi:hypothetical protein